jgi:hypothetical protein
MMEHPYTQQNRIDLRNGNNTNLNSIHHMVGDS